MTKDQLVIIRAAQIVLLGINQLVMLLGKIHSVDIEYVDALLCETGKQVNALAKQLE